jgi:integrase
VFKRLGIKKRVTWHAFRRTYTTFLRANGEAVKVVQELLRHSSSRITMDIYAQAPMPAKRAAQQKVGEMVRSEKPPLEVKRWLNCSPNCSAAETGDFS